MNKKFILIFALTLLVLPIISAEPAYVFKQYENLTLCIPVFNSDNSEADASTDCYLTLKDPEMNILIQDQAMTFNSSGLFCYDIDESDLGKLGEYPTTMRCDDGADYAFSSFVIEITPSGFINTIGFYIVIMLLSLGIMALGFWKQDAPIVILGSFGLYFLGLYILFYGLVGIKDPVYTWSSGIIILMLAAYISVKSSYELIVG